MLTRRGLISGLFFAPAIVKSSSLMKLNGMKVPFINNLTVGTIVTPGEVYMLGPPGEVYVLGTPENLGAFTDRGPICGPILITNLAQFHQFYGTGGTTAVGINFNDWA